ncbi:MAG: HEAT repeat domain-containing protein [Acidobacteriota bacterium]
MSCLVLVPFVLFVACFAIGCRTVREEIEHIHSLGDRLEANPTDRQSLAEIEAYLHHSDRTLRTQAVSTLGNAGAKHLDVLGDEVVPLLIARLTDDDAYVRRYAVVHLGHYGSKAVPAVPALIEVLRNNKFADSGLFAAEVLGNLGTPALPAVPELIQSLDYRGVDGKVDQAAIQGPASEALFKLSPLGAEYVAEMQKRLDRLFGEPLALVALAILKSQPKNTQATQALARVLADQSIPSVIAALLNINRVPTDLFDQNVLVPALAKCSQSPNHEARDLGSEQLARFKSQDTR